MLEIVIKCPSTLILLYFKMSIGFCHKRFFRVRVYTNVLNMIVLTYISIASIMNILPGSLHRLATTEFTLKAR